jgi:two-component system NtrC family sensor kinase
MHDRSADTGTNHLWVRNSKRAEDFLSLSRNILGFSNLGPTRVAFLKEVSGLVLDFSGCDIFELRHHSGELTYRWRMQQANRDHFQFEILAELTAHRETGLDLLCDMIASGTPDPRLQPHLISRSLYTRDVRQIGEAGLGQSLPFDSPGASGPWPARSLAAVPFECGDDNSGVLVLLCSDSEKILADEIVFLEGLAQTVGLASANRRAQESLRERVKELTCLYGIARIAEDASLNREVKLQRIVNLLPVAWQYPDIAVARIDVDGHTYLTPGYSDGRYRQKVDVTIFGRKRGTVEVAYVSGKPELVEGPFLKEEASLIMEVARQIAAVIEKEEAEAEKRRLEEQLRHTDRLATIGQLAAGVAHELNEPLASILGFAQLARKSLSQPQQVGTDLDKIVNTSLRAREIVRKLLIFARQVPAEKSLVNLNTIVDEALSLFELRFAKEGIELVKRLTDPLPRMEADPTQISQLLVNLIVNAVQAMPQGGRITLQTSVDADQVVLVVADTGVGMTDEVKRRIFTPFFTTKDPRQGTGLGLSVVHGIVVSHGGTIAFTSSIGQGTSFEVRLPVPGSAAQKKET